VLALVGAGCRVGNPRPRDLVNPYRAPQAGAVHHDLAYGNGAEQLLDVYQPRWSNHRVLVWFHGGGWERGSKSELPATVPFLFHLLDHGWTIVAADYSTTPLDLATTVESAEVPVALDDARLALEWVDTHSAEFGITPGKIAVGGESAGGTIAALLGTLDTDGRKPVAWMAIDGPMDLRSMANDTHPYFADITPSRSVAAFLQCPFDTPTAQTRCSDARLDAYSPIDQLDATDPPGYLVGGAADDIVPPAQHGIPMEDRANQLGSIVAYDLVDSGNPFTWTHNMSQWGMNFRDFSAWLEWATL
jgi:acetyl esterase/lipase